MNVLTQLWVLCKKPCTMDLQKSRPVGFITEITCSTVVLHQYFLRFERIFRDVTTSIISISFSVMLINKINSFETPASECALSAGNTSASQLSSCCKKIFSHVLASLQTYGRRLMRLRLGVGNIDSFLVIHFWRDPGSKALILAREAPVICFS